MTDVKTASVTEGWWHVEVYRGRDLLACDVGGTSDPYLKIGLLQPDVDKGDFVDGHTITTKAVSRTTKPEFKDADFTTKSAVPLSSVVRIQIWDKDVISKDDFMGQVQLRVGDGSNGTICVNEKLEGWVRVLWRDGTLSGQKTLGFLDVSATFTTKQPSVRACAASKC